jgi:DNA-binding NtrC family response regulator
LTRQDWPGNVRELRSAIERAVLLADPQVLSMRTDSETLATDHWEPFDPKASFRVFKERAVARWERWFLRQLLSRNGGNLSRAARSARMDRNHLRELLHRHNISVHKE